MASAKPERGGSPVAAYALLGAPDVTLVAVLIETLFTLLFVATFALLPRRVLMREAALRPYGVFVDVGLPTEPVSLPLRAFVNGGKSFAGSQIGGDVSRA